MNYVSPLEPPPPPYTHWAINIQSDTILPVIATPDGALLHRINAGESFIALSPLWILIEEKPVFSIKTSIWIFIGVLLALILITFLSPEDARADSLLLGGWSYHLDPQLPHYNSDHNFRGIEVNNFFAAQLTNSYYQETTLVGYQQKFITTPSFSVAVVPHISYGYRDCGGGTIEGGEKKYCPAVALQFQYTRYRIKPSLLINGRVLFFYLDFPLGN